MGLDIMTVLTRYCQPFMQSAVNISVISKTASDDRTKTMQHIFSTERRSQLLNEHLGLCLFRTCCNLHRLPPPLQCGDRPCCCECEGGLWLQCSPPLVWAEFQRPDSLWADRKELGSQSTVLCSG